MHIPTIQARGTPYEVGYQIGIAARDSLREMWCETRVAYSEQWASLLQLSAPFVAETLKHLSRVYQELHGCADGADIPLDDLFLMSVEELLYEEVRGAALTPDTSLMGGATLTPDPSPIGRGEANKNKGCSDLAAAPPATMDGHLWLAHNNDLGRGSIDHLFVTRFCVDGEPEILAVTVGGIFISIAMNAAGIALTGNQLTANDSRVGVPRLLIVRDLLAQTTLDAALKSALSPVRASSYNNIIASRDGRIVNVEGSATDYALTWSHTCQTAIVHTNHYLSPKMQAFEADPAGIPGSATRCARATDYAEKYNGKIGLEVCQRFVRDHVYAPWSVCKHAGQSVTVFSAIIDLTELKLWLARGNPCQSEFELYQLGHGCQFEIRNSEFGIPNAANLKSNYV